MQDLLIKTLKFLII